MIISFSRRFIFVKTRKTAGTSAELALSPYCGPRDILTPLAPPDELARVTDGVVQARNYADWEHEEGFAKAVLEGRARDALALTRSAHRGGRLYAHAPAVLAKRRVPADFWAAAFKFAIERHPYEKAVSGAYFRTAESRAPASAFPRLLDGFIRTMGNEPVYTINGRLAVNRVVRYENLAAEFDEVTGFLGLDPPPRLPHAKAAARPDRRPASEILTADQKLAIFRRCRATFEMLGYEP